MTDEGDLIDSASRMRRFRQGFSTGCLSESGKYIK